MISALLKIVNRHRTAFEITALLMLLAGFFCYLLINPVYYFLYLPKLFLFYLLIVFLFILPYAYLTIKNRDKYYFARVLLMVFAVVYLVSTLMISHIFIRHNTGNNFYVHDSIVLTEVATKFLSEGKNFYQETYYDTPYAIYKNIFYYLNGTRHDNPAMVHYPYLPFIPVFSLPFYYLFNQLLGFFDQRFVHFFLFLILLPLLWQLPKNRENKILLLFLFCFNPFFLIFFVAGYNDIFVIFWLILSLYFLSRKVFFPSAVALALACGSKQTAWLILPFYFFYSYLFQENILSLRKKILGAIKKIWPFFAVSFLIYLPYVYRGLNDFVDDIYRKQAGTALLSYPIFGMGFSFILQKLKLVKTVWDYFPFWIFQLFLGLPVMFILLKIQKRIIAVWYILFSYGLFLFVFWYFSRYFNDSHFGYLALIFTVSFFMFDQDVKRRYFEKIQ